MSPAQRTRSASPHGWSSPGSRPRAAPFTAAAPDRLWVADITYVPTWAGFLYLAVVLDVHTRRIVGWAMADHLRSELVIEAVDMAVWRRRPREGVIHHSDQGSQYTSLAFGRRLREAGLLGSMGSRGDCFDNATAESFFATLAIELLARHRFPTRSAARLVLFDYITSRGSPTRTAGIPRWGICPPPRTRGGAPRNRSSPTSYLPTKPG